jgi:hypothetical protein
MIKAANGVVGYEEEHVTCVPDPNHPNRFLPKVMTNKKSGLTVTRDFEALDMARVLDYEEVSGGRVAAVRDEPIMVGDYEGDGTSQISFPIHHVVLRGGFIFCFQVDDVDEGEGRYTTFEAPPVSIISLDRVEIQFPPGGRRVFREHAQTAAQSGYELIIQHMPPEDSKDEERRPPAFLVTDSLGKRNKWAEAIKARSKVNKPTLLRAGYTSAAAAVDAADPMSRSNQIDGSDKQNGKTSKFHDGSSGGDHRKDEMLNMVKSDQKSGKGLVAPMGGRKGKTGDNKGAETSDDANLAGAVVEFGEVGFDEKAWVSNYWKTHHDHEAAATCDQMEKWLQDMKKSLKGAVLEQYEYFVQASGEMTTMGREVTSLKARIETQVDLLKEMKDIDFLGALKDENADKDVIMGRDDDESEAGNGSQLTGDDLYFNDDLGDLMNKHRGVKVAQNGKSDPGAREETAPPIEIPDWLDDVDEEITAIVRECRYNAAIELYLKAGNEIADLLDKHEQPTAYRLTSTQLDTLRALKKSLKAIGNRISSRLEESLRRKNEAIRQATKRERSDVNSFLAPLVSPCALSDDTLYLQLLVKLGRTQEAADAYSGRRSLLLLETLQERPMSGAGTVDLVIYAAQLSQSFFSCLASSVEGFLDLFLMSTPVVVNGEKADDFDSSSLHSNSLGTATKNLPAGAVSALVLWCDSELSKFANAFGGTRILSNLALSPPKPVDTPKGPRVVGDTGSVDAMKERRNAIEVAAQCLNQAFLYAAQNLDSVGLPLTPRLAEMVRIRLKGCEQEVSLLLDERWHNLTQDWRTLHDSDFAPPRH